MSVRAYRVNKIETEEIPTFNCWQSEKFMDFIERECDTRINASECSISSIEVSVDTLKKAIKKTKQLELDKDDIIKLKEDIKFAKSKGDTELLYSCW